MSNYGQKQVTERHSKSNTGKQKKKYPIVGYEVETWIWMIAVCKKDDGMNYELSMFFLWFS